MSIIKNYNIFLEHRNQEEVDFILDKISDKGIKSLTEREKEILDNWDNPDYEIPYDTDDTSIKDDTLDLNTKEGMIEYIENSVEVYKEFNNDNVISLPNLQEGITYKRYKSEIHIIKYLDESEVIIVPITKKNQWKLDESKSYRVPYVELHTLSLHKIINLLQKR